MTIYFGENLKKLRKEKNLTQEALAEFLGISFQSISKWERDESYPDITMLPSIASFFSVTTDALLGIDKNEQAKKIKEYIESYYSLWQSGEKTKLRKLMKKATTEFPGDFDLMAKYLNALLFEKNTDEDAMSILNEAKSIYDNIQNHCTNDSIRIWTQKMICMLYKRLAFVENSGINLQMMEEILENMPLMQNGRDYLSTLLLPPGEKHDTACKTAFIELLYLLCSVCCNYFIYSSLEEHAVDLKISSFETMLSIVDAVCPDGDYGKNYLHVIYAYAHLGRWRSQDHPEKAFICFEKCIELAKKFDALPEETQHSSPLVAGVIFKKQSIAPTSQNSMKNRIKYLLTEKYEFPEEFKESEKFKVLITN